MPTFQHPISGNQCQLDDSREPSHAEVERTQAKVLQERLIEIKCLTRELEESRRKQNELDQECKALHVKNGELNLEVANLTEQLGQLRSQLEQSDAGRESLERAAEQWKDVSDHYLEQLDQCREQLKALPLETPLQPLKADELAARLGVRRQSFEPFKNDPERLARYTRERDPDGIA